jgi:type VI protein secretion system component VasK
MVADVGLGEILWSLLLLYLMVMYIVIVFTVWLDIARSDDLSGAMKAVWVLALLFFPVLSLVVYLLTRGDGLGMRNLEREQRSGKGAAAPPPPTPATELSVAKQLLDAGTITSAEYDQIKARVLG